MVLDNYKKAIKENRIVRWEETSDYPSGKKTGEVSIAPVFNEKGICTHLVGSMHDITDLKVAEKQLEEREQFTQSILMSIHDHIAVLDRHGVILAVNKSWIDFGCENDVSSIDMVGPGQNYFDICRHAVKDSDESARLALEGISSVLNGSHKRFELEYPCHSESEKRWFLMSVMPMLGTEGGVVVSHANITERKQAEARLKESEEKFRNLVEQSPLSIMITNPDGKVVQVNSAFVKLWEMTEDTLGEFYKKYNMLQDMNAKKAGDMPLIEKAYKDGESVILPSIQYDPLEMMKESGFDKPSGRKRWIQCRIYPTKDEGGRLSNVVHIIEDITERKQVEESLKESEEKFRNLVDQSPLSIQISNPDGKVIQVNPAYLKLWGITESILGELYEKYNVLQDRHAKELGVMPLIEKAYKNGEVVNLPSIQYDPREMMKASGFDKPSGRKRWIQTSIYPTKDEGGRLLNVVHIEEDITDRKQAEEKLVESETKYRQLVEDISDVIYSVDTKGDVVFVSPAIKSLIGYDPHEVIGKHFSSFVHAEDIETMKKGLESALAGKIIPTDYRILNKAGSYIWGRALSKVVKDDKNNILGIRGAISDITERKRIEEELRISEQEKSLILNNTAEIIAFHDQDHNIKWVNKAYLEATGLSISKIIGQKCFHAWGLDRLCTGCPVLVAMETGEPQEAELTPQNQEHWPPDQGNWAVRATPVKDDGGYVIGAIEVAFDITLRKQAEEKIRYYTEKLKALAFQLTLSEEKERRHIAADLHDHIGHSLALARMQLDAALKATSKTERTVLINDVSNILLDAIQGTKDLIFELSSPLMNEIGLATAISEWLEEYMERRYGLETELTDKCEDVSLDIDLRAILFRNVRELFTNIIKHSRAKKVSVVLEGSEDSYIIKVKDDGIGFDLEKKTQEVQQERGFGLFSIKERMADLGGSVEILSQPGKGTQIIMSAPIKNSDSKKQT
jgi:PAS domain S-box-containing protein